ncbi:MAG TPA: RDD family protein [Candidatus Angelobacter sp.]
MACPVCGKSSPCAHEHTDATVAVGADAYRAVEHDSTRPAVGIVAVGKFENPHRGAWRDEVISRVQQHRARRRKRYDPDGTMELDFPPGFDSSAATPAETELALPRPTVRSEPKIIEFPKPVPPTFFSRERIPEPEDLELAGPVLDGPRILDAPEPPAEQMDLLPAFADIQLEAEATRPGAYVDLPPQPAPLSHRIFAGLIDLLIVLMAVAGFAVAFLAVANSLPQPRMLLLYGVTVCASLWLLYQYLFLVYGSATVGMHLAQLELCTFRGDRVSLPLRRWRALASVLSAFALGLGFAWAFVDEDTLGWHDRMTQTHVRKESAFGGQDLAS